MKAKGLIHLSRMICRMEKMLTQSNGEHFNVFRILNIRRRETRTHTPMLRELLDPNGSHGQGADFLQLFLQECGIQGFDATTAKVREEFHIGKVSESEGGRLDLYLKDRTTNIRIGIENKIDAMEQENQIQRYQNFLHNGYILYLTLNGSEPTSYNPVASSQVSVQCISYAVHITRWLEACHRIASSAPLVRETITQYLHLVKELTNQKPVNIMQQEYVNAALKEQEDLEAFFALCNARSAVTEQIIQDLEKKKSIMSRRNLA